MEVRLRAGHAATSLSSLLPSVTS